MRQPLLVAGSGEQLKEPEFVPCASDVCRRVTAKLEGNPDLELNDSWEENARRRFGCMLSVIRQSFLEEAREKVMGGGSGGLRSRVAKGVKTLWNVQATSSLQTTLGAVENMERFAVQQTDPTTIVLAARPKFETQYICAEPNVDTMLVELTHVLVMMILVASPATRTYKVHWKDLTFGMFEPLANVLAGDVPEALRGRCACDLSYNAMQALTPVNSAGAGAGAFPLRPEWFSSSTALCHAMTCWSEKEYKKDSFDPVILFEFTQLLSDYSSMLKIEIEATTALRAKMLAAVQTLVLTVVTWIMNHFARKQE